MQLQLFYIQECTIGIYVMHSFILVVPGNDVNQKKEKKSFLNIIKPGQSKKTATSGSDTSNDYDHPFGKQFH